MKIYTYNAEDGSFLGETFADENPLELGKFLIPAFATSKQVIEEKEGYTRHFVASGVIGDREMQGYWEYREIPKPEPEIEPEPEQEAAAEDEEQS